MTISSRLTGKNERFSMNWPILYLDTHRPSSFLFKRTDLICVCYKMQDQIIERVVFRPRLSGQIPSPLEQQTPASSLHLLSGHNTADCWWLLPAISRWRKDLVTCSPACLNTPLTEFRKKCMLDVVSRKQCEWSALQKLTDIKPLHTIVGR